MRGVTFSGNRQAELQEFPNPQAGPGEAVVKVRASGLCGTDLHRYRDPEPTDYITGHEPCGVIEDLGDGALPGLKAGDRVMVHHYAGCGICEICAMALRHAHNAEGERSNARRDRAPTAPSRRTRRSLSTLDPRPSAERDSSPP